MTVAPTPTVPEGRQPELDLLVERASGRARSTSLLFVHGINVDAWVWQPHYLPYFAAAGFNSFAVSLRGHGESAGRDRIRQWQLGDYVGDVAHAVARIDGPVVLVGHSMGGAVVQRYVRDGGAVAGMALLAAVPPWGLAPSALQMSLTSPQLLPKLAELLSGEVPRFDPAMLREALFSHDASASLIEAFARHAGAEAPLLALELQGWPPIGPLPWQAPATFVLGARNDRLIPAGEVQRTGFYYGGIAEIVPDLAHAIMVEPRWEAAAERLAAWLSERFS